MTEEICISRDCPTADLNTQITERTQGHPNPSSPHPGFYSFGERQADIIQIHLHVSTSTAAAARRPARPIKAAAKSRLDTADRDAEISAVTGKRGQNDGPLPAVAPVLL